MDVSHHGNTVIILIADKSSFQMVLSVRLLNGSESESHLFTILPSGPVYGRYVLALCACIAFCVDQSVLCHSRQIQVYAKSPIYLTHIMYHHLQLFFEIERENTRCSIYL